MMSITPLEGHCLDIPSVHHAGQRPALMSIFPRITKRPYFQLCRPEVLMLEEVYSIFSGLVFQSWLSLTYRGFALVSFLPSMISNPFSHQALSVWYHCSSRF